MLQLLAAVRSAAAGQPSPDLPGVAGIKVGDLCNAFLLAKARAGRSDRYLGLLIKELRTFAKGRSNRPAASISAVEIEDWLCGSEWAQRTRRGRLMTVRNLYSWAVTRGELAANPALGVDMPSAEGAAIVVHTPAEVRQVLETMRRHDINTMRCLAVRYFAGLRTSEATALEEKEIRLADGFIEVTAAKAKTRRRRLVTIQPNLAAWLKLGGKLPLKQVANRLAAVPALAGVEWPNNVCRHSFCSYHLAHFSSAGKTALEAGHSEAVLFQHYRALVTTKAATAFWKIGPKS